jgi:acetyl esterase
VPNDAAATIFWIHGGGWGALQAVAVEAGSSPLIIAGDSAGGNMSAACAVRARDHGGPEFALQVLVCPVADHDMTTGS